MSATRCSPHRSRRSTAAHSRRRGSARFIFRRLPVCTAQHRPRVRHARRTGRDPQPHFLRMQPARMRGSERAMRMSNGSPWRSPEASVVRRRARLRAESSRSCSLRAIGRAAARLRSAVIKGACICCWGEAIVACISSHSVHRECARRSNARCARCVTRLRRAAFLRPAICGNSRK